MNVDTNEVISPEEWEKRKKFLQESLSVNNDILSDLVDALGFQQVPDELDHAAKTVLKGRDSAFVSKTSGGKLSNWAKQRRGKK